jgi:hypothetical protein
MRAKLFGPGAIALASLIIVLPGCGGNSASRVTAGSGPFAKTFTGEIDDRSGGLQSINFTVAPDGTVSGSSIGFTVSGTFSRDGHATLVTDTGTLTGTFSQPSGQTIYAKMANTTTHKTVYAILLVSPSPSNFGYMGYQRDTTKNTLVPIAFTIDSSGQVSGTVEAVVNDSIGFAKVAGTMDSGGNVNLSESQNSATLSTVTGVLTQSGNGILGNVTFRNADQGVISGQLITG